MKKFTKKILVVFAVLCVSLFALTACGDTENENTEPETPTAEEEAATIHEYENINTTIETADDYFAALDTFTYAAKNVKTDLANRLAEIDTADTAKVQEVAEAVKKPFTQFLNVTPSAEYTEANKYYADACNQIIEYIDKTIAGEDAAEILNKAMANIQTGTTTVSDALANSAKSTEN
ncbi:MAG: hypothetical protein ACOX7J_09295 [Bacillota bacterium]|jgi:hypothetical protein